MKRNTPSADDTTCRAPTETPSQTDHSTPLDRPRRRRLLQAITAAGATSAALPDRWSRPVVDSVLLPAHAQATPTDNCEITCTTEIYEVILLRRVIDVAQGLTQPPFLRVIIGQGVLRVDRTVVGNCVSLNGAQTSSSFSGSTSDFTAYTAYISSTGTQSTITSIGSFTGPTNRDLTLSFFPTDTGQTEFNLFSRTTNTQGC